MRKPRGERMRDAAIQAVRGNNNLPKMGCEVGVWAGGLSSIFLRNFDGLVLYMVDCFLASNLGDNEKTQKAMKAAFADTVEYEDRRIMLIGKSLQVAHLIQDKSLDFVYIDAAHDKESVTNDISTWYPKVKKGGVISGHDYSRKHPGVITAVDEFTKRHNYSIHKLTSVWWFLKR